MGTTVHSRSPPRGRSPYLSSPSRNHSSPPRRLHRKERSPDRHRSSMRTKSTVRTSISHGSRSPAEEKLRDHGRSLKYERSDASRSGRSPLKEKLHDRARSPKYKRSRSPRREKRPKHRQNSSPVRARSTSPSRNRISRSPSPRTMRLKRALEDRKAGQLMDKEHRRGATRGNENGRQKEHAAVKEIPTEKKSLHDRSDWSSRTVRRDRSISLAEENQRSHYSSGSPSRSSRKQARDEVMRTSDAEQHGNDEDDSVARMKAAEEALEAKQKEKPSFELSGKLAEETNRVRGVTLLFTEPADARKPDIRWRLYVFKAGEVLNEPLYVHRQSCYLFGRERRVADIPTDHPSCSKQHAVIQYRLVEKEQPDGMMKKQVRPYLMDLGSTNGTYINDNRIEPQRYYELFEKDTVKFGNSSREYVVLHENSVQ